MATLTLDRVSKVYGERGRHPIRAVSDVDMAIEDGEIVGLLGSSGCGKTSTLRMIAGFESISGGEIRVGDRVVNPLPPAKRNVAMAFEGYALYPPLTIRDNIAFGLLRDRTPKAEVEAKVCEIADLLEIGNVLERYPPTVSAGQQQRAGLARALVRPADLYLLDEPMGQLEPRLRAVLRARIKEWLIERKMTTIIVTHDQTEALALCDRIAVMEAGVLQQFAGTRELKDRPANLFVASFIGEPPMNVFDAQVRREGGGLKLSVQGEKGGAAFALTLPGTDLVAEIGNRAHVKLGIRPHLIEVVGAGDTAATIVSNQWLGDQTHLGLEIDGVVLIAVTEGTIEASEGATVRIALPLAALHLFDPSDGRALMHGAGSARRGRAA